MTYDDSFRESADGDNTRQWVQGDSVLFTACLAGMGKGQEGGAGQPQMGSTGPLREAGQQT